MMRRQIISRKLSSNALSIYKWRNFFNHVWIIDVNNVNIISFHKLIFRFYYSSFHKSIIHHRNFDIKIAILIRTHVRRLSEISKRLQAENIILREKIGSWNKLMNTAKKEDLENVLFSKKTFGHYIHKRSTQSIDSRGGQPRSRSGAIAH